MNIATPPIPILMSVEAEQSLLGSVLLFPSHITALDRMIGEDDFGDPVHARIWAACRVRALRGHMVSPVSIGAAMSEDEGFKTLGGPGYLARMSGLGSSKEETARHYAEIIKDYAIKRRLRDAIEGARSGLGSDEDARTQVSRLQSALMALPASDDDTEALSATAAVTRMLEKQVALYQGQATLLKTGFDPLDRIIGGLDGGDLVLLGGATSMGKTAVAVEMAHRMAARGCGVAYASLEMQPDQIMSRITSTATRIPYAALRDANTLEETDFRKWVEGARKTTELPLHIIPRKVRDVAALHAAALRIRDTLGDRTPLSALFVDYAQLLRAEGKGRYEQMTNVSIGLKTIAGMLNIPVIALVQLDRQIHARDDKRPNLNDIKESGQFENDADVAIFCHREEYYLERQGPRRSKDGEITADARADFEADKARAKNRIELIVRKMRQGQLGVAEMGFHNATNRFWNLSEGDAHDLA